MSKSFPGRGDADSVPDRKLLEHKGLGAKCGKWRRWWSVGVGIWVQEEGEKQKPTEQWRGLAAGPRADRGQGKGWD